MDHLPCTRILCGKMNEQIFFPADRRFTGKLSPLICFDQLRGIQHEAYLFIRQLFLQIIFEILLPDIDKGNLINEGQALFFRFC